MGILNKIEDRSAKVAVIGLGYVGLPMAIEMAKGGYQVYGVDIDPRKVALLQQGKSYIIDIADEALTGLAGTRLHAGTDFAVIEQSDVLVICVPTPLDNQFKPDTSYIQSAIDSAVPHLRPDTLVSLESTTYPGTTEELIRPAIEQRRGWTAGKQFYTCYSPERVDPGSVHFHVKNTPKIIGGSTPECLEAGLAFYSSFLEHVVPVSSTTVAETAKLFENTFRSVNIGLINELTPMCEKMGISVWEVLDAAATKPFGYMPFYPGPGIGGHCIPVDPLYLSWKSEQYGLPLEFIGLADRVNRDMPPRMVRRISELLGENGKSLEQARVVVSGVAYKKDIDDVRESPALALFALLVQEGAEVSYHDPFVASFTAGGTLYRSLPAEPALWASADIVIIATDHSGVDYQSMADHAPLVFDTRYATKGCRGGRITVLGRPLREGGTTLVQ